MENKRAYELKITGEKQAISSFASYFPGYDVTVDEGWAFIYHRSFESMHVQKAIEQLKDRLRYMKALTAFKMPVTAPDYVGYKTPSGYALQIASLTMITTLGEVEIEHFDRDGNLILPVQDDGPYVAIVKAMEANEYFRNAVSFLHPPKDDFSHHYIAFEYAMEGAGPRKKKSAAGLGWASMSELTEYTKRINANDHRHGGSRQLGVFKPLDYRESHDFVARLLRCWAIKIVNELEE